MRDLTRRLALAAAAVALFASAGNAQTNYQFPLTPWKAYAPTRIQCGKATGLNFNTTSDQAIPISVPSAGYLVDAIVISNPSVSLTTAAGGFYTAASKSGIAIVASGQTYSTLTTNAANTAGNAMSATLATAGNTTALGGYQQGSNAINTLYLSLTTPQGAAATADVRVYCRPLY